MGKSYRHTASGLKKRRESSRRNPSTRPRCPECIGVLKFVFINLRGGKRNLEGIWWCEGCETLVEEEKDSDKST
jgi:hypothetical protein